MKRISARHPSVERLREWLLTGEPAEVGAHVEQCERCAARLETLDPVLPLDPPITDALRSAMAVPADLGDRVVQRVTERSKTIDELALLASLMAVGVDTARLLSRTAADAGDEPNGPRAGGEDT